MTSIVSFLKLTTTTIYLLSLLRKSLIRKVFSSVCKVIQLNFIVYTIVDLLACNLAWLK